MADRPIIFSAPMVRALLAGRKTQTRRIFKVPAGSYVEQGRVWAMTDGCAYGDAALHYAPGDRLYVREAWRPEAVYDDTPPRDLRADACMVRYEADGTWTDRDAMTHAGRPRPSIHMPRWASRLTLGVTEMRVQRLQEISEADAMAEGAPALGAELCPPDCEDIRSHVWGFHDLWNSLHGLDAWDANHWVVAVSFTVDRRNIDSI